VELELRLSLPERSSDASPEMRHPNPPTPLSAFPLKQQQEEQLQQQFLSELPGAAGGMYIDIHMNR